MKRTVLAAFLGFLALVLAPALPAQVAIFALFGSGSAPFDGQSVVSGRANWVDIDACNFGFTNETLPGAQTIVSTQFSRIGLVKRVDRVTPAIFATLVAALEVPGVSSDGAHVTLDFASNQGGGNYQMLFRLELKNVRFNALSSGASQGASLISESVEMSMGSVRLTPYVNGVAGQPKSWSVLTNSAAF